MSEYIKSTIQTKGWKEIEEMFDNELELIDDIDESIPSKEYKIIHLANVKASKKIRGLLNRIKLAGGGVDNNNIRYK
jgi:hypothetical protein